jgi:hypothetical protein
MADDTEFRFVTASVRRAARLQREYVESFLGAADSQRAIGEQFAELCDKVKQVVDDYEQRHDTTTDAVDRRLILNAVRELLAWTRSLQLRCAWLDAAAKPPIDLGSLYYLRSLAKAIVRPDSEFTVVAAHEGSYATVVNPFRVPSKPVPDGIVLVALVPHREIRSGLLHPLLAHEIGHGVAKVYGYTEQLRTEVLPGEIEKILDDGAQKTAADSKRAPTEERAVLDKRLGAWIEEIFCDAVATACLGATYLFSFATEVLPDEVDVAGPKHPPTRQRVRLILGHLDRLGWGPIIDREVPGFASWVRGVASARSTPQRPADEALRAAIDLAAGRIQGAVDQHVATNIAKPDEEALAAVAALLAQRVPPAQHDDGTPIARPMIIAGCWLSAMKTRSGNVEVLADAVDSNEVGRLLPYALELSAIVDRWQAA